MTRAAWLLSKALVSGGCTYEERDLPVTLRFPDFPDNVAVVDLGQTVTIDVEAANDDGVGVTWSCAGAGCAPLKVTPTSVTFKAIGITGKAVITATSRKHPNISRNITVSVSLNDSPDMLCK
jgi:hypothetical protein